MVSPSRPPLSGSGPRCLVVILVCALAGPSARSASESSPGWLDVRDVGASGSDYETPAKTTAGSTRITVADVGDFRVGEDVLVTKSNIHYTPTLLWGTGERYQNSKPVAGSVEVRGADGRAGDWVVYVLDIAPSATPAFRWSDDLGRTWRPRQRITHDWQKLSGGVEVRLNERDWQAGYVIAFGARDELESRIVKIEGQVVTLRDPANRSAEGAVLRHNDTPALQAAFDRALKEKLNVRLPVGHYRLAHGLRLDDPSAITIEGASSVATVLDISDGEGRCITISGGTEATIRNLRFVGFMGFDERDKAGELHTLGSTAVWGFSLKPCHALDIVNTERVLVENCHASRMSGECFFSSSRSRPGLRGTQADRFANPAVLVDPPAPAGSEPSSSQGITYLRCSVTDCARNAFNDVLCGGEFTTIQGCRIVDVGGNAWEGASRFVKFVGNYLRNAGSVGIGNLGPANRDASYPDLGAGQIVVADNVFEQDAPYGGCAIKTSRGATQVIIRNNIFVNFGTSAIQVGGRGFPDEYPASNTTITGNSFDMTAVGQPSADRTAITVAADDTIISDNQIYVRGAPDPAVVGILVREPARNLTIHDNLLRNCGGGLAVHAAQSVVSRMVDATTFVVGAGTVPSGWLPHRYRGWNLAWFRDGQPAGSSVIANFEPLSLRFVLREPREIRPGDSFEVYPSSADWNIHDNVIAGCLLPLVLDSHGSGTSVLRENLISRGDAPDVPHPIELVRGQFELLANRVSGFGGADSN